VTIIGIAFISYLACFTLCGWLQGPCLCFCSWSRGSESCGGKNG
jgi:hypothetical protein